MKKANTSKSKYITKSSKETQVLGLNFAKNILKKKNNQSEAVIIVLSGDLGGGKTTFLQGFARGLGIKEKILSPTFVIQKKFNVKHKNFKNFYHIDCYRLVSSRDILELGFDSATRDIKNIIALEWPEKIKSVLKNRKVLPVKFKFIDSQTREISF